jgi:hypothetical protein
MAVPIQEEDPMKVPFEVLRAHFPDKVNVSVEEIMQWIGHADLIGNANFENTCAIRLSLGLLGAGFPNPGVWPILGGKFKGRAIETKMRKLSTWLTHQLGQPEKYSGGAQAQEKIGMRHGIIAFFQLHGPTDHQGHIDIVMPDRWNRYLHCGNENDYEGGCFWSAVEVWFWPLK